MSIERKMEYFNEAVNQEVESKKRKLQHEMTTAANDEITTALTTAAAEAQVQTLAQLQAIQKVMNKRISLAQAEARRTLATLRERLTAQLFDSIKEDIVAFTQSSEYESFLIASVKSAQDKSLHPYAILQLTPNDMHLGETMQEATGLTPEPEDENMLGGYKLVTENRSKILEFTLSARLSQARQEFMRTHREAVCEISDISLGGHHGKR
ncbi:MAG: V-type ATP synthase subunit E [Defluviitaleaceae bacterium]|nr:V-type ATP synthase subunit E [Defluviitaleaceae bacterium]